MNLAPLMISASWCEPFRRCHFLLADWQILKTMVMAILREKLIKIGAKVVRHGRYITFQMA